MSGGGLRKKGDYHSTCFWGRGFSWILGGVLSLSSAIGGGSLRGHRFAGGFGHGGQDSLRYPGAREPHRLCS
jgi:hypothetical protein